MRIISLDTETTGLKYSEGHRIIEIGAIDIQNNIIQSRKFHQYINPEREVDARATEVHGFTYASLKKYPSFENIQQDFLDYLEGADMIVIHNADFDLGFLKEEYRLLKIDFQLFLEERSIEIVDTLIMARQIYPGRKNSLDALCKRFDISLEDRTLHGALLDAKLLAQVFLSIQADEAQADLFSIEEDIQESVTPIIQNFSNYSLPVIKANSDEIQSHESYIKMLEKN